MQFKTVTSASLADILLGRSGLIVGPGATVNTNVYTELARSLKLNSPFTQVPGLRTMGRLIRDSGRDEEEARAEFAGAYNQTHASPYLASLAKPYWKAVLSLAPDSYLEDKLQVEFDNKPARRPITRITDLTTSGPGRITPVYKMLGAIGQPGSVLFEEDYLRVRATWRHALASFCDILKGSPALCIGVDGDSEAMLDLVSEMLASRDTRPSGLVVLADDALLKNKSFIGVIKGRLQVLVFTESLSALVGRISSQESVGGTRVISSAVEPESSLTRYADVCVMLNPVPPQNIENIPKVALLDSLFSPSVPDWNPYFSGLDFRREIESRIIKDVRDVARASVGTHSCVALTGSAANGKTTLLKRIALELATIPHATIWVTSAPLEAPDRFFHEFFRDYKQEHADVEHVFCFIDDPIRSRSGEVESILESASSQGITLTLIIAARSSEWSAIDHGRMAGYSTSVSDVVLPDDFSTSELDRLPSYLTLIDAAGNEEDAMAMLGRAAGVQAKDVLNTLYLVVPSTRSVIVSSVRDEYCRLGDLGGLREQVRGALAIGPSSIREAYELTAVANLYGCDLPFELLRAAIGFEWSEAKDLLASNSAVWGILYTIDTTDSVTLRTRNQIVADTIVQLVNGGLHGRSGEVRILLKMIEACGDKSSIMYRNFIAKLLIGNEMLNRLNYDDGRQLYEAANSALVAPDRALVHHMGIWADRHSRSAEALQIFRKALTTPSYPYAQRAESDINIHTSMASAVLNEIQAGTKSLHEGKREAEEYLAKARGGSIGDAHVVHINSGITLELIRAMPPDDELDKLHMASNAVGEIDKLDMLDESPLAFQVRSRKSQGMLQSARESLYAAALPSHNQEEYASKLWEEQQNQDGFIVVARKRLIDIRQSSGKGSSYKQLYDYILSCKAAIAMSGRRMEPRFAEVQADVFYWWRVHRAMLNALESEIEWSAFLDVLGEVIRPYHDNQGQQRWYQFLKGYALCQLGDWAGGEVEFSALRRADLPLHILHLPRTFLLNAKGGRTRTQGTVADYGGRLYLDVPGVQTFIAEKRDRWNEPGLIDHAHIQFSFAGPRAVHDA